MLNGKVVIITGASSGIGEALAHEYASRGAHVVLGARQYVTLCEIAQKLENEFKIRAVAVQCDVSREEDCAQLIKQAVLTFGRIDVLINNAGISMRALFRDVELDVLKKLMDVNFWGTVYCTKYALPELLKSGGSVAGVSSVAGFQGLPGRTGYSASKFAMNGFLEALRVENLKTGLHVLTACPGFTASNIRNTALNKAGNQQGESSMNEEEMMTPQEVAVAIADAIAARKDALVLTRQGKLTLSLKKLLPGWVNKQVYKIFAREKGSLLKE
ncbi:MAG: SDR family oxidoreductase [Mucilaginibacter polytrichastri]|nr:SDR family oxidoreductase [Mucilaginibacter polytrichastri]